MKKVSIPTLHIRTKSSSGNWNKKKISPLLQESVLPLRTKSDLQNPRRHYPNDGGNTHFSQEFERKILSTR